jgi:hypothetical protein
MITVVALGEPRFVPVASLSLTVKVSLPSAQEASTMGTRIVLEVFPQLKVQRAERG